MGKLGGEGYASLYLASIMMGLCWIVVSARVFVRYWKNLIGLDDILMVVGLILYSVTACLVIVACFCGSGQYSKYLFTADIEKGTKIFFVAEFFYASCTVPIKWSICVCMIRIAEARRTIVYVVYAVMGLSAVSMVIFILTIANICHPIQTLWGAADGTCNTQLNSSVSFFFSAVSIVTDWTLATIPFFLLWRIQMNPRTKISCCIMLSLGVFASCATLVRLNYLTLYNDSSEFMYSTGAIGLWSILEEGIGIISGSMPALRPLLSLSMFRGSSADASNDKDLTGPSIGLQTIGGTGGKKPTVPRGSVEAAEGTDGADDDGDSQKQILKQTQINVTEDTGSRMTEEDWTRQQVLGWQQ